MMIFFYIGFIITTLLELVTCQGSYSLIPTGDNFISQSFARDVSEALQKSVQNERGSTSDATEDKTKELLQTIIDLAEKYRQNNFGTKSSSESDKKIAKRSNIDNVIGSRKFQKIPLTNQRLHPKVRPVIPKREGKRVDPATH